MATLSDKKKKAYREQFNKFDKNKDKKISKDELRSLLKTVGRHPSDAALQKVMNDVDKDKSGFIEYNEFEMMMIKIDAEIEKRLKATFNQYDKDKSGFITLDELQAAYEDMGIESTSDEVKQELERADVNADGKLNFDEFKKLFGRI
ncbi:calmodulin-1-like isoform X2 [Acanthaster planci]|uniref:Calmodulin-1-like isoform X2 n=1 Tax=Acanthaster planci TaxID=133434 RepID=A0A8B7YEI5_ACAPL|nr:calmodulin-1-like isoform X2 [Acanthaster planci]